MIGVKIENLGKYLKSHTSYKKIFVITNTKVGKLYSSKLADGLVACGFEVSSALIPDGEKYKNLKTVEKLYLSALQNKVDRRTLVIALGGGVVGDIAGFFAAKREIQAG